MTESEVVSVTSKLKDMNNTQVLLVLYRVLKRCHDLGIQYTPILLSILRAYSDYETDTI